MGIKQAPGMKITHSSTDVLCSATQYKVATSCSVLQLDVALLEINPDLHRLQSFRTQFDLIYCIILYLQCFHLRFL